MYVVDKYNVYCKDEIVGWYAACSDGSTEYRVSNYLRDEMRAVLSEHKLDKDINCEKAIPSISEILSEENRVAGTRKQVYRLGDIVIKRIPDEADKFMVFNLNAKKGKKGYSKRRYSVPHCEGGGPIEGMEEWVCRYCFNRMDDGTYEAELDEAWFWGGSHNDGGTIHTPIPEEWFLLDYDEFLENVVTLSKAKHFGFTAQQLAEVDGLREFFEF